MTYPVYLFNEQDSGEPPQYWKNYCQKYGHLIPLYRFNNLLKAEHHTCYNVADDRRYLDFESEAHYSMFVLRWS